MTDAHVAVAIFVVTYALIVSERVHKTTAALLGAVAVIAFHVLETEEAWDAIDLNVVLLLAGMMVIANTTATTGVFQWIAIRSVKAARGSPMGALLMLCGVTAGLSAFLDNVTTVVLIAPVTILVAETLGVRIAPMLIAEAIASNIGGTITLIGDPPNILIGSFAGVGFAEFTQNVGPGAVLALAVYLLFLRVQARREMRASAEVRARVMTIPESDVITDPRLLRICLGVLAFTMAGFLAHGALGYEPSAVALTGATVLLLITRDDPHHALRDVEWSTLFFFIGLFVVVAGLEHTGVLGRVGREATEASGGSLGVATMLILWLSTLLSGIVDNIPYTATMLPVVRELGAGLGGEAAGTQVLWWALAMGADLGGNLTVIGASANVLVANLAARSGHRISFWEFFRFGLPATLVTVAISTGYLWLRFLAF
ncbi:MAG: ArsB/NhaD family transporter [Chloroflexi bacterium]|nr:ArsB/NhaD family transporter [Chloroflexota bacterium]